MAFKFLMKLLEYTKKLSAEASAACHAMWVKLVFYFKALCNTSAAET